MDPRAELERLTNELLDGVMVMGSKIEQAILDSVTVLKERDHERAKSIYVADKEINKLRYELEEKTIEIIVRQQPVARDVRMLAAILEIITELERMGDYAKGIARISIMIGEEPLIKPLIDLPRMAELTADMLHRALKAFADLNDTVARELPAEDDKVDDLYNQVYRELLTHMLADPKNIDQANFLLWAAHNLERVADRVINICERTVYVVTGEIGDFDQSDDELGALDVKKIA